MVPSLADKCTEYLQDILDPSNVFGILPSALRYEEKNLVDRCWKMVDKHTEAAVKSDGFATIERSLLEELTTRSTLNIDEIELFKAVDFWGTEESHRRGLQADGKIKRRLIGEQIIYQVRFPTMELKDVTSVILNSEILTPEELYNIEAYFTLSGSSPPMGILGSKRSGCGRKMRRCRRFNSVNSCRYVFPADVINFSVDREIWLHGLCLFGSKNCSYSLDLEIHEPNSETILASKRDKISSELLSSGFGSYYGFEVLFDVPVALEKNTIYCVKAKVTGPCTMYGNLGIDSVSCSDVRFNFFNSEYSESASNVSCGQFPELLFSI